tara:strand:+ start:301 stop:507 length:207 start_codon:yes stop_codon:yes gene_type:complete
MLEIIIACGTNGSLKFRRLYMKMNLILIMMVFFTFTVQAHHDYNISEVKVIFAEEGEEKPTEEEPDCE